MASLREWLVKHEWFIIECDPGPNDWYLAAVSPLGYVWEFKGPPNDVKFWHQINDNW